MIEGKGRLSLTEIRVWRIKPVKEKEMVNMFLCRVVNKVLVLGKWVPFNSVIECKDQHEVDVIKDCFAGKVIEVKEISDAKR